MKEALAIIFALDEILGWITGSVSVMQYLLGLPHIVFFVAMTVAAWLLLRRSPAEREIASYKEESWSRGQC